ncbi:hypothetical protein KFE25_002731 [Diacronema lutheri]|uniref:Uncharacterized protein n=1 Tax=Diacronema lutheri TaxID=2081491 RepID=A0A8J5XRU5_DIALT|nr:hypothetical protein KFE25_002731 [Diacronema lutheri]
MGALLLAVSARASAFRRALRARDVRIGAIWRATPHVAILAEKRDGDSCRARLLKSTANADAPHDYEIMVETLMHPLRHITDQDIVRNIGQSIVTVIAGKNEVIASKEQAIVQAEKASEKVIAAKEQAIVQAEKASEKVIAAKDEVIAAKNTLLAQAQREMELGVSSKTSQLALYKEQFEPRIMVDTLWAALTSAKLHKEEDEKQARKWRTLLRDVLHEGKLTAAAKADLNDLDGAAEELTVISDLGSLPNRLASPHHSGATDVGGTGWRIGTSPSPHLATALVLSANVRTLQANGVESLRGDVIYLDRQFKESHRFDMGALRWVKGRANAP